jgi:hypothetical protein
VKVPCSADDIERKKKLGGGVKFDKKVFLTVCHCAPGTHKNFPAKKSFPNAKKVIKKFLQGFASFDPLDVEGAAFHTFDAKTFGGVIE